MYNGYVLFYRIIKLLRHFHYLLNVLDCLTELTKGLLLTSGRFTVLFDQTFLFRTQVPLPNKTGMCWKACDEQFINLLIDQ